MTANAHRGEVDFVVEEKTYLLRLAAGDIAALQEELKIPTLLMLTKVQNRELGYVEIAAILQASLMRANPKQRFTRNDAYALMDKVGASTALNAAITVFILGISDPEEREEQARKLAERDAETEAAEDASTLQQENSAHPLADRP